MRNVEGFYTNRLGLTVYCFCPEKSGFRQKDYC